MIMRIPLVLLLAAVGGSLADPSGEFTAGAVIRFPADDLSHFNKASYKDVQGISYYATGPNSAHSLQQAKIGAPFSQDGLFSGGQESHSFALNPGIQDNFFSNSVPSFSHPTFPPTASTYLPKYPPQPFPSQHMQSHSSTQYAPVLSVMQAASSSQFGAPHTPTTFEQLYPSPSLSTPSPFPSQFPAQSSFPPGQYAHHFPSQSNENLPHYTQQFPPQTVQHSPQQAPQFPQNSQPSSSQFSPQSVQHSTQQAPQFPQNSQPSSSQFSPQYVVVPQQSNSQFAPQTFPTTPSPQYHNQNQPSYSNPSFVNPNQNRNPTSNQYQVSEEGPSYENHNQHTQQQLYQQNSYQQNKYSSHNPSQHSDIPYNHRPSYQQQPMKGFTYGPPKVNLVSHRPRKPSYTLRPNALKYHKYKGNSYALSAEGSSHVPAIYGRPVSRPPIPHSTQHLGISGMMNAFFSGKPAMPPARDTGYNTITKEMLNMKQPHYDDQEVDYDEGPNYQYKRVSTGNDGHNKRVKDAHDAGVHGNGQKTPVVVYKGMRPPVSVYHKQQVTTTKKNPGQYQQRQHVVAPADLAGGRSASSPQVTAAPDPSNWVPINAHDGAVPARAYTIQAPDLSRSDQVAAHEFTGNVEIESQPIVGHIDGKHGVLHQDYPRRPDAASAGAPKFPRRPEMTERRIGIEGSSEEVVSAVVLVKQ